MKPIEGENMETFIQRVLIDEIMREEFPHQKDRENMAIYFWNEYITKDNARKGLKLREKQVQNQTLVLK